MLDHFSSGIPAFQSLPDVIPRVKIQSLTAFSCPTRVDLLCRPEFVPRPSFILPPSLEYKVAREAFLTCEESQVVEVREQQRAFELWTL
jgi:hypothetical protein